MESIEYLKTMCPLCDGSIEFPMDALGQRTDCPHCKKAIVLGSVAPASPAKEMFGDKVQKTNVHLLSWLSSQKRQVLPVVCMLICTLIICSVVLFFYLDQKAEQRKRDQAVVAKAEADAKAKEDQDSWDAYHAAQAKKKADYAAWLDKQQRQRQTKAIVSQLDDLNDTVERARINAYNQNEDAISEIRRARQNQEMQQLTQPRNADWVLRYNGYANQWQYAPPDAVLKYNGFQDRYEFVPK